MERFQDFWHTTEAALRSAARQLSIEATVRLLESLMQAYLIPVFADTRSALEALRESPLAILSNGSPGMGTWPPETMTSSPISPRSFRWTRSRPTSPLCACTLLEPRLRLDALFSNGWEPPCRGFSDSNPAASINLGSTGIFLQASLIY